MKCRHCNTVLKHELIDLYSSPLSNSFLTEEQLNEPEVMYPLRPYVCESCFLVQIDEYKKSTEIFNSEYVYFSSYSSSWLEHSKKYADTITEKLNLDKDSFVIEVACNDGYLLQYFKKKKSHALGLSPALQLQK